MLSLKKDSVLSSASAKKHERLFRHTKVSTLNQIGIVLSTIAKDILQVNLPNSLFSLRKIYSSFNTLTFTCTSVQKWFPINAGISDWGTKALQYAVNLSGFAMLSTTVLLYIAKDKLRDGKKISFCGFLMFSSHQKHSLRTSIVRTKYWPQCLLSRMEFYLLQQLRQHRGFLITFKASLKIMWFWQDSFQLQVSSGPANMGQGKYGTCDITYILPHFQNFWPLSHMSNHIALLNGTLSKIYLQHILSHTLVATVGALSHRNRPGGS